MIDIEKAAECIREGRLVAFPTETVYGLGANALDPLAVARIFEIKERPSFDPLIVHISSISQLEMLALSVDERVYRLADKHWPGALTIVLPKSIIIPDIVTSGLPTVGIRMPGNEIALELIRRSGCPIAAPSANKFGQISPTTSAHVRKQLPDVECIIEGGKTTLGIESTIIELTELGFRILRNGAVTQEEMAETIPFDESAKSKNVSVPGMLRSHYSPSKKFMLADRTNVNSEIADAGLISFSGKLEYGYRKVIRVSERGCLYEYAANMFAAMHAFQDDIDIETIVAEPVCERGIGKAIMDRLRKAEYRWKKV